MNDMLLAGDDRAILGLADRLNFRTKLVRPGFIRLSGVSSKGFPTGLGGTMRNRAILNNGNKTRKRRMFYAL